MRYFGIDPGPCHSGIIVVDAFEPLHVVHAIDECDNEDVLEEIKAAGADFVVIEDISLYAGACFGKTLRDTCHWGGRFAQRAVDRLAEVRFVGRHTVGAYHTKVSSPSKAQVNMALRDRHAPGVRNYGRGTKKEPGPLYLVKGHAMDALALVTWLWDQMERES